MSANPRRIQEKEKPRVKDKSLHSAHSNRVVSNPWSQTKKVKDVMKNNETQDVATSDHCQRMQKDLIKPHVQRPLLRPLVLTLPPMANTEPANPGADTPGGSTNQSQ